MSQKLLVIGLDGYETTIGERMMREGRLPVLAELTRRCAQIHLDHGPAKRTGLAWEHFSTALAPEAAARWSAVDFDPNRYRCTQKGTALTPFPAKLGVQTVVFDPPYFDIGRAPDVQGIVSWGAHDPGTKLQSHPPALLDELRERFGDYPAKPWIYGFTWPSVERTREMGRALVEATRLRARIAQWLLNERMPQWALGMVVVSELHSAVEALWHGVDENHPLHGHPSAEPARIALEATYEAVDGLVDSLIRSCPDATVLVFSMHGMGPNESDVASMVLLAELLYRRCFGRGLLQVSDHCPQIAAGVPGLDESQPWSGCVRGHFAEAQQDASVSSRTFSGHRARSWIPDPLKRWLKQTLPMAAAPITQSLGWMPAAWYSKYWPVMDAFALPSFYDGQIRINLEGREARGRVSLAQYDRIREGVADDLVACIDPRTGRSVVREVIPTHRKNPGELGPTEADLTIVWEGSPLAFAHPTYGTMGPLPYRRTGGHTGPHGVAWLAGPDIEPGFYGTRSAFDVAPTIREFLLASGDSAMSGKSFLDMITRAASRAAG